MGKPHKQTDIKGFDEDSLRVELIGNSGKELMAISGRTSQSIRNQMDQISQSINGFNQIKSEIDTISEESNSIHQSVHQLSRDTSDNSSQLESVFEKMKILEDKFADVNELLTTINSIADQTNLLALNATIEGARAGDEGKGFAVVASEVKELSRVTKSANEDIQKKIRLIGDSITDLSSNVQSSREKMNHSMDIMSQTRSQADNINDKTQNTKNFVDQSLSVFNDLEKTSHVMNGDLVQLETIAKAFHYLLNLVKMNQERGNELDPLERLTPLVSRSDFKDEARFSKSEEEYILGEDEILISATDLKGKITFANKAFYDVAQYAPGELVGKPHNIIRHPDMPKTAFGDLWDCIKDQKLWQGYVLNKGKLGRVYWVKAIVYPCYEGERCVGYLSVRSKPEREAISKAISAYRCLP